MLNCKRLLTDLYIFDERKRFECKTSMRPQAHRSVSWYLDEDISQGDEAWTGTLARWTTISTDNGWRGGESMVMMRPSLTRHHSCDTATWVIVNIALIQQSHFQERLTKNHLLNEILILSQQYTNNNIADFQSFF